MDTHPMPTPAEPTPAEPGRRTPRPRHRGPVAVAALATVLALGACGGRTTGAVTTPAAAGSSLDREVELELREIDAVLAELDSTLAEDLAGG